MPFASQQDLFSVLRKYNPWWDGGKVQDVPSWTRAAFAEFRQWMAAPPAARAVLISGARQVGKTTLMLQLIRSLLADGVEPERIFYATFDHPLLKLVGLEEVLNVWREIQPPPDDVEYLFLDEIQYTDNWQTWIKHEVDFNKRRRIAVTGSAIPLNAENVESGVGRWHSIKLATLSFYEYLQIKKVRLPRIPEVGQLTKVIDWPKSKRIRAAEASRPLIGHFHEYILRGGFPQTSIVESIPIAQKLLREDIVDKVLKREMTALFGVRNVLELERTFLYLCLHDGGILDIASLSSNLRIGKPTAMNFINLLEAANLVYKLPPFGYGKEILRGRYKVYLADAAIAGSVLLKGKSLLEDAAKLGAAVETAFFKHVFARYYGASVSFSYWRSRKALEVDVVAEVGDELVPFEVKYERGKIGAAGVKGLIEFCSERKPKRGYVITKDLNDFELLDNHAAPTQILKIPAPLACYWLSQSEPRP